MTSVYIEAGGKRTFASAAGWPGWCRSGKTEQAALEALAAYAPRYAKVTRLAGVELPKNAAEFEVVERLEGNATTDFGAPGIPAKAETKQLTARQAEAMAALVEAAWKYLDKVVAQAPAALRKGPRGGGRDRDKIVEHVLGAEVEYYARAVGLRMKQPPAGDARALKEFRQSFLDVFAHPNKDAKWPVAYAARRTAWHALDHAWEIEDRST